MKNEVRPIDANELAKRIREYMKDFKNSPARKAAYCDILSMLGDEGQTPTLQLDCDKLQLNCNPLTLEQLREMDGKPVWMVLVDDSNSCEWMIVDASQRCCEGRKYIVDFSNVGTLWLAYAYQPAHIDREAWTGCVCNSGKKTCCTCVSMQCHSCIGESKYKQGRYCSACGRPLTEDAWAELEKRLRGISNG